MYLAGTNCSSRNQVPSKKQSASWNKNMKTIAIWRLWNVPWSQDLIWSQADMQKNRHPTLTQMVSNIFSDQTKISKQKVPRNKIRANLKVLQTVNLKTNVFSPKALNFRSIFTPNRKANFLVISFRNLDNRYKNPKNSSNSKNADSISDKAVTEINMHKDQTKK